MTQCRRCDRRTNILHRIASRQERRTILPTQADGYCLTCAQARKTELVRSDKKAEAREWVKATKSNAHANDCAIVAASVALKMSYDRCLKVFRSLGFRPNKRTLAGHQAIAASMDCAALKGKKLTMIQLGPSGDLFDGGSLTPRDYLAATKKSDRVILYGQLPGRGHAMTITDGELNNVDPLWARSEVVWAAKVEKAS